MSEDQSIARPYAQAVFELAQASGSYREWSEALAWIASIMDDARIRELLQNPRVDNESLTRLVEDVAADKLFDESRHFLRLVVKNGRAFALPSIAAQYEAMRAEAEGTIEAELISALEVSAEQQANLAQSLSQRLGREVALHVVQDPGLIGGAILRAGDMVIDASLKGRLKKLGASLAR